MMTNISNWRCLSVAIVCAAVFWSPQPARPCAGSFLSSCVVSASPCLKSLSLAKSAPTGMGLAGFPGGTLTLEFTLTATCQSCPGTPCATPAMPTGASVSVAFFPGGPGQCPPAAGAGAMPAFAFSAPVSTPACSSNGAFTIYTVVVPVPAATPRGLYCAYGTVTVTFSDGMTLAASGGTTVCIVEPAPGMPTVPRLSVTLLTPSAPRLAPGDTAVARYSVKNNDPSNAVTVMAIATSRQSAVRPQRAMRDKGSMPSPVRSETTSRFNSIRVRVAFHCRRIHTRSQRSATRCR